MDPLKSQEVKYRTLKRDNAKLQQTLFSPGVEPYVRQMLLLEEKGPCGFITVSTTTMENTTTTNNTTNTTNSYNYVVPDPPSDFTRQSILTPLYDALGVARQELLTTNTNTTSTNTATTINKKLRMTTTNNTTTTTVVVVPPPVAVVGVHEKLSEKQKARKLLQEKEVIEKELARKERQRQKVLLQQDKWTRENDPNWKPGLSAACAKSGSSISTFRDKYGEN